MLPTVQDALDEAAEEMATHVQDLETATCLTDQLLICTYLAVSNLSSLTVCMISYPKTQPRLRDAIAAAKLKARGPCLGI